MSELIEQLACKVAIILRPQGALRLIRQQDCGRIVRACKSDGLLILGIEAFKLAGGKVIPVTDLIADFSELASKQWEAACLQAAHSAEIYFNESKDLTDLWFDFSLIERP